MRILRIADVPNNRAGGMARMMHLTGDCLRGWGHQVDDLFGDDLGPAWGARLRRFVLPWKLPRRVRRCVREAGSYDVVEIHEPLAMGYTLMRKAGLALPPCAVLSHGLEARSHAATLAYRRRSGLPVSLWARYSPLGTVWQANRALRFADAVICLNAEDEQFLLEQGLARCRVFRIANGIDDDFLRAGAARSIAAGGQRMLFCATWLERKGVRDLVPAIGAALRAFPEARFTAAGCGVAEATVRECFPADLQDRVEVIPWVAPADLIALYARHDVFVLPSYFEGFPLAMLEAAALKLAIVATETCGMKDFLCHRKNGLLVAPGQPDQLAARLQEALGQPDWRRQWGEAAYQSVQSLTWAATARGLLTAYEATGAGHPPQSESAVASEAGNDRDLCGTGAA
jgi:glycosyltransferase involved in cell wall biosynthesis